ncbi:MAG: nuclear transport factor 2 family protein [Gammaproteobacteria bacterium]
MESWKRDAIEGVRKTLAEYAVFTDSGRFEQFLGLFLPDGVFVLPKGDTAKGPAEIAALLGSKREAYAKIEKWAPAFLRHNVTTENIDIVNEREARVEAYFMVCTDRGLDHWGRWEDELVRCDDDRWRFRRRRVFTEASYAESWYATAFGLV